MAFAAQQDSQHQRYELVSALGRGGMAEVFLGWMNSVGGLRRKVAIKRILPELVRKQSRVFEQMFVDEARLAFQLEHDNIVRVYDVGQSGDTFFIVMEYVEGMDLKRIYEKLVERKEFMPLEDCLYVGIQMALGLSYAHSMTDDDGNLLGLIHNDISPPNVLVGRHGEVKIADFGLSDAQRHSVDTPDCMVKGRFACISPETTRDPSLVSLRSDIFSAGIVLWELIAGQRLFQKSTDIETFKAVRDAVVPDLRKIRPDVPPQLMQVVQKSLAADPNHRYQSCEELFEDLNRVSYECNLPPSRLGMKRLVSRLRGEAWTGFQGEKISEDQKRTLLDEIATILPPGVADHLKTFVTRAQVADDVEDLDAELVEDTWMDDVFADAGYDLEGQGNGSDGLDSPPLDYGGDAGLGIPEGAGAIGAEMEVKEPSVKPLSLIHI